MSGAQVALFIAFVVVATLAQGLTGFAFVLVLLTLEEDTRQALIVTPLWFIALGLGWLFIGKKRMAGMR